MGDGRLLADIEGAQRLERGGVLADVVRAGDCRIKRVVYPSGYRWSNNMKPQSGTEWCMHAHVGFLAQGEIEGRFSDGCSFHYRAPAAVVLEPGHDGWVVGDEVAVLIQFDCEGDTVARFGLPETHRH